MHLSLAYLFAQVCALLHDNEINVCSHTTPTQMKLVMSGGQEELEKAMSVDKETYECVAKLNQIMGKMNKKD
jgi:hypothetical protein